MSYDHENTIQMIGHVTILAITGTSILVPYEGTTAHLKIWHLGKISSVI